MSTEIESTVATILESAGITFAAFHTGTIKNALGGKTEMDRWACDFTTAAKPNEPQTFTYYTGLGHRAPPLRQIGTPPKRGTLAWEKVEKTRKPVKPAAAGVLHSLILDSSASEQSFASWCEDFGYDTDSRKAINTYEACQENSDKLAKVLKRDTLNALREALQDY